MTKAICSVAGCTTPIRARGWCSMHYERWRRTRTDGGWQRLPVPERFWAKVDRSGGPDACWPWTAARSSSNGYGVFWTGERQMVAHRWAWEQINGPVPDGLQLDHFACDNRPCVNPKHVRPVTQRENVLRGNGITAWQLAKTHCKRGHPFDEANTYVSSRGKRQCRRCHADETAHTRRQRRSRILQERGDRSTF